MKPVAKLPRSITDPARCGNRQPRAGMMACLLPLLLLLLPLPTTATEDQNYVWSEKDVEKEIKNYRSGFYLGWGWSHISLDVDLDQRSGFTRAGVELDGTSKGGFLLFGLGLGPNFTTEMKFMYFEPGTETLYVTPRAMYFTWDSICPLTTNTRFQPYLAAGFGVLGLYLDSETYEKVVDFAAAGNFGGGLLVRLSPHAFISLDYRYAVLNFEREMGDLNADEPESHSLGRGGNLQFWAFNICYDF